MWTRFAGWAQAVGSRRGWQDVWPAPVVVLVVGWTGELTRPGMLSLVKLLLSRPPKFEKRLPLLTTHQ